MPGYSKSTIGYHGDDGEIFYEKGSGNTYGPTYTTNDVIGCGLDLKTRAVFFTKNGTFLGIAQAYLPKGNWYPTVALHSENGRIKVNFGEETFAFDTQQYEYPGKYIL